MFRRSSLSLDTTVNMQFTPVRRVDSHPIAYIIFYSFRICPINDKEAVSKFRHSLACEYNTNK